MVFSLLWIAGDLQLNVGLSHGYALPAPIAGAPARRAVVVAFSGEN